MKQHVRVIAHQAPGCTVKVAVTCRLRYVPWRDHMWCGGCVLYAVLLFWGTGSYLKGIVMGRPERLAFKRLIRMGKSN